MAYKLSGQDADFIRVFYEFGFTKPQLAQEYSVHVDTVRSVIVGRTFKTRHPVRSKHRKLTDDQVRQVREWAAAGMGDIRIARKLGGVISRSTVKQVIDRKSYQEVV